MKIKYVNFYFSEIIASVVEILRVSFALNFIMPVVFALLVLLQNI